MLEFIVPAPQNLLTIENLIWINLGVFIGSVFAAIPGLSVILCIILFLPFTYQMTAIPGMMFLLGIYCAGGYGGSVSAILINTPGTPHAAATMLDGYPLNQQGRTKAALRAALLASTFGGIFSALMLPSRHISVLSSGVNTIRSLIFFPSSEAVPYILTISPSSFASRIISAFFSSASTSVTKDSLHPGSIAP